jgi:CcmD family protein
MKRVLTLLLCWQWLALQGLQAQATGEDFMRGIGKIYVVVAVIAAIFVGIVVFLIYLDRRLTKLENQINRHD